MAWEEVRAEATGRSTAAWFHPGHGSGGRPAGRGVVVAHGVWGDRNDMVPRGELLAAEGFAVLLVDLYAHGETFGWRTTFGWEEADDLRNACAFLRSRGVDTIHALGVSLGAVAAVFAHGPAAPFRALVLEAPYADLASTIRNRGRWVAGALGEAFTPLLIAQIPLRLGLKPSAYDVAGRLGAIACPKLLVTGGADERVTREDSERIWSAAAWPKARWVLEGVDHADFLEAAPAEYAERVLAFLRAPESAGRSLP